MDLHDLRQRLSSALLVGSSFISFLMSPTVWATAGDLDPTFGGTGIVTTAIGNLDDRANAVAVQRDGKVVAAGFSRRLIVPGTNLGYVLALTRNNADGSPDTGFNGSGIVTMAIGPSAIATAVAIQVDGRIVAVGTTDDDIQQRFVVVRYNANGSLDPTFNGTGIVITAIGAAATASAVVVQPDGKIVVGGTAYVGGTVFALARYNPDGSLDTSFNTTGIVTTSFGYSLNAVALQTDGKIVIAGSFGSTPNAFALARYNPNGSLDTTFNGTGKVVTDVGIPGTGHGAAAYAVVIQSDGRIVAAGFTGPNLFDDVYALARYRPDGSLDPTFGGTGIVTTMIGKGLNRVHSVAIQADGKIVAMGSGRIGSDRFPVVRYNIDGTVDPTFNHTGIPERAIVEVDAGALAPDGKIVVAGSGLGAAQPVFAAARFLGDTVRPYPTPTLSQWGLLALTSVVAAAALASIRRRRI